MSCFLDLELFFKSDLMDEFIPFTSGRWHGVCAAAWRDAFGDLDAWLRDYPGTPVVIHQCRQVRRIQTPQGTVFLKYIYALTDAGMRGCDPGSWLKWVLRPSRAITAWKAAAAMAAAGLRCPVPLLAARRRLHGYPNDLIVTAQVPWPDCWAAPPGESPAEVATAMAAAAWELHQPGFAHGDFILRNLCRDGQTGETVYLDNDRTWQPPALLRRHCQRRNLAQMAHSLDNKFGSIEPVRQFLERYAELAGWPDAAGRERLLEITRRRHHQRTVKDNT